MSASTLNFGQLTIQGVSRAGLETWFRVHPPGLAFDVGRGAPQLAGAKDIFLTHGHLDHALGLPFLLSLRSVHRLEPARVFCPRDLVDSLNRFLLAAAALEVAEYAFEIVALTAGDEVRVGKGLSVEAFATDHRVPSLGYHLVRQRHRLSSKYRESSTDEILALKQQGVEIEETFKELWLSYCGDTGPAVFDLEPRLYGSSVLMMECTFFDPGSREQGRQFRHIHLEDLATRSEKFCNQDLVLYHASQRYQRQEILQAVEEQLSTLAPKVHLFGH
jgi:ribonuclease Z